MIGQLKHPQTSGLADWVDGHDMRPRRLADRKTLRLSIFGSVTGIVFRMVFLLWCFVNLENRLEWEEET